LPDRHLVGNASLSSSPGAARGTEVLLDQQAQRASRTPARLDATCSLSIRPREGVGNCDLDAIRRSEHARVDVGLMSA